MPHVPAIGVLLWLALTVFAGSLAAETQPSPSSPLASPRGALHEGYGRLVIDWDAPVNFSADVVNNELLLRFDRPVSGDFHPVLRPLGKYLQNVVVSADGKTASFRLARPIQVKASVGNNNAVVVDLLDDAGTSAAVATPAAPTTPATGEPPEVDLRSGDHGTFVRLVFEWPAAVTYKVESKAGKAQIVFGKPARIDLIGARASLPPDITLQSAEVTGKSTVVDLSIPDNARLRHFPSNNRVVVDVVRAANATAPVGSGTTPLAPAPGTDVSLPAMQPLVPEEKPKLPSESLQAARPTGLTPVKPIPEPKAKGKSTEASASAAPPSEAPKDAKKDAKKDVLKGSQKDAKNEAAPAVAASEAPAAEKVFSLSVSWEKPVAAAVFRRAGYLWMVFDRAQEVDTKLMRRTGGEAVLSVEQVKVKDATAIRLLVQPDYLPSVRRDNLLWVVDLIGHGGEPKQPIDITIPASLPGGIGIGLTVAEAGNVVQVADPEVGDTMVVVPVIPLGAGVYPGRDTPDVELLTTTQGIAMVPHVDGLDIKSSRAGVTIAGAGGGNLRLSSDLGKPVVAKEAEGAGLFHVGAWKRGGEDKFDAERRLIGAAMLDLPPERRAAAHLQAARFFFANGYAAEALGFLRIAATDDPTIADTAPFRSLRGAAQVLMQHWDLAQADLDNPLLKDDGESQFWRAAAYAGGVDNPGQLSKALAVGLPLIKEYPHRLRWPLAALAATSAIAAADDGAAQAALDVLDKQEPTKAESSQSDYLHAAYEEMSGHFDKALEGYQRAAEGDNREYRAKGAQAGIELELKLHKASPQEAAERLDRLRFAWREEPFEFGLLRRYAELEIAAGDYPNALRALRSLVNYYPDNKDAPIVSKMMSDTFAKLYLDGAADMLQPISAIGLFDEFRDLTPTGPKGDEMIRKLADRLASVDLLDRAAELLKHQVNFRLQGLDKARVGAQLAVLDLLNRQPQAAVDALQASEADGVPPELHQQRIHLKARALADLDQVGEAAQLLVGDASTEASLLRAEIYWHKQNWPEAAAAFEALVSRPGPGVTLDDASSKLVVSWATALNLANDERALAALRRNFLQAMLGTPYKDAFDLLTSAADRELPDMSGIAAKIREAEAFKTFMTDYKKRIQTAGLSAIN